MKRQLSEKNDGHHRRQFPDPNCKGSFQPTKVPPPKVFSDTISSQIRMLSTKIIPPIADSVSVQNLTNAPKNSDQDLVQKLAVELKNEFKDIYCN